MYVFYDFETSGTDLLDQILSFAFLVTDDRYQVVTSCVGTVKLNRCQWPNPQAILTNKLDLTVLQETGITEWDAAEQIYLFLQAQVQTHGRIVLVGYNNAKFDWEFLRSLLTRYGFSPYFMGKIRHLDLLYVVRQLYFSDAQALPLPIVESSTGTFYTKMTLESVATALGLLEAAQSHDALDDVRLCIRLTEVLSNRFQMVFSDVCYHTLASAQLWQIYRQKTLDFSPSLSAHRPYTWKYWMPIAKEKNGGLLLDLQRWIDQEMGDPLHAIKYTNQTLHDLCLEPVDEVAVPEAYREAYAQALATPDLLTLTMARYFETPPDWDIAYQVHQLGFQRLDTLRYYAGKLIQNPDDYETILKTLWDKRENQKDRYLVQLFNRVYLAVHPNPRPAFLRKYLEARYVTGVMYRNLDAKPDLYANRAWVQERLEMASNVETSILQPLLAYYDAFLAALDESV